MDPIHLQGLRIALGALRTFPVTSLYAKAQEMSLKNKSKKLSMSYVLELKQRVLIIQLIAVFLNHQTCLLYTSPSPRDNDQSRMPSSA